MIRMTCPSCGRTIQAPDEAAGRTGKCECGERVRINAKSPITQIRKELPPASSAASVADRSHPGFLRSLPFVRSTIAWLALAFILMLGTATTFYIINAKKLPALYDVDDFWVNHHAGIVNKYLYQKDEFLKEMEKELGTSLASELSPELVRLQGKETLDRMGKNATRMRFWVKFVDLKTGIDKELEALNDLAHDHKPNERLQRLIVELQAARDKVDGIVKALPERFGDK